MVEVKKDLFDLFNSFSKEIAKVCLVCTVNEVVKNNGELVMGAGIAKEFRDRIPGLALAWGDLTKNKVSGQLLYYYYKPGECDIVGLPTKKHWKNPSDIKFVTESLKKLYKYVEDNNVDKVLMTRPGCGNGGLEWSKVKSIMEDLNFDDRFLVGNI